MGTGSGERGRICRITGIERQKIEQAKDKIIKIIEGMERIGVEKK